MKEIFDFKQVKVEERAAYLQPGTYVLGITDAKYVKPTDMKKDGTGIKSPYLEITFAGKLGKMNAMFYVTPKTWERLQYLYIQWFDEECSKAFESLDAIGAYFEKLLTHEKCKKITKRICVGGKTAPNGKVYAELNFLGFVIPDTDPHFEEGPFEVGSAQWTFHVKTAPITAASSTDSVILSGPSSQSQVPDSFDLPF